MSNEKRVVMIGLDCADPVLVFERFRDDLPNLMRLASEGMYGPLRSCEPPITCPAWSVMLTGKDPGTLGVYGFRNRADYSYDKLSFATSLAIREPRLWDILGRAGKRSIVLGVPQTFPVGRINGLMVSCFLTPSTDSRYTHPPELADEIQRVVGPYMLDVEGFRSDDKDRLLADIHRMTRQRFQLAEHLLRTKPWDFFMMVEMGPDRLHHAFWQYMDATHPKHVPGNPHENAIHDYYVELDGLVGRLLEAVPDDAAVWVTSDHGAQAMAGGICVNEWLIQKGYLVLKEEPAGQTRFKPDLVDWSRTKAWGEGGYYARVFLNVQGREPRGVIPPAEQEAFLRQLAAELEAIPDQNGEPIGTRVHRPADLYHQVNGIPPDLIVYFGDLTWRSVGSVGMKTVWTFENDTGPDDANHAPNGLWMARGPGVAGGGRRVAANLLDVAPTLLRYYGLPVPGDMQGACLPLQEGAL